MDNNDEGDEGLHTLDMRRRKISSRRSSILKLAGGKSPTRSALTDLDVNSRARRVSFSDTRTVKEFIKSDEGIVWTGLRDEVVPRAEQPSQESLSQLSASDKLHTENSLFESYKTEVMCSQSIQAPSAGSLAALLTKPIHRDADASSCVSDAQGFSPQKPVATDFIPTLLTQQQQSSDVSSGRREEIFDRYMDEMYVVREQVDYQTVLHTRVNKYAGSVSQSYGEDMKPEADSDADAEGTSEGRVSAKLFLQRLRSEKPFMQPPNDADNKTIHFHDDDPMEFTLCRENQTLVRPGAGIEIPNPSTSSVGNKTRIYDPNRTQQDEFDMELTTCLSEKHTETQGQNTAIKFGSTGDQTQPYSVVINPHLKPSSEDANRTQEGKVTAKSFIQRLRSGRPPVQLGSDDENKTIHFQDDDPMEITLCGGNRSLARPGIGTGMHDPSTSNAGNKTRIYDPNKTQQGEFDMDLTTCISEKHVEVQGLNNGIKFSSAGDQNPYYPNINNPIEPCNQAARNTSEGKVNTKLFLQQLRSRKQPVPLQDDGVHKSVDFGHPNNKPAQLDLSCSESLYLETDVLSAAAQPTGPILHVDTAMITSHLTRTHPKISDNNNRTRFHDNDFMELTVCRGNQSLVKPVASMEIPKPSAVSVGNRTRVYDPNKTQQGEFDMELTTCLPQQTSQSLQDGVNVVVGDPPGSSSENPAVFSPTNDDNKTIRFHDDDKLELTVCRGNQSLAKPEASIEIPKPSTVSVGNRTRLYDPNRTQQGEFDMELTTCLPQQTSESLQLETNIVAGNSLDGPTYSSNEEVSIKPGDNNVEGISGYNTNLNQQQLHLQDSMESPNKDDNKTIRFHGDELMELTACRGNQSLVIPGASIEIPKPSTGSVGNRTRVYDPNRTQQGELDMELTTCLHQQISQSLQDGVNVVVGDPGSSSENPAVYSPTNDDNKTIRFHDDDKMELTVCIGDQSLAKPEASIEIPNPSTGSVGNRTRVYDPNKTQQGEFDMDLTTCLPQQTSQSLQDGVNVVVGNPPDSSLENPAVFSPTNDDNKTIRFHGDELMELTACRGNQSLVRPGTSIEIPKPPTGSVGNRTRMYDPNKTQQDEFDMELTTCLPQQTSQSLQDGINVVADNSLGGPTYSSNEEANMKPGDNNVERVLEDNTNLNLEQFHSRNQVFSPTNNDNKTIGFHDDDKMELTVCRDSVSPANVVSLSPIVSSGGEIPRYGRAGTASETPSRNVCDTEAPSNDCLGESDPFAKRPLVFYSPQMPSTTTRRESPVRAELSADSAHQVGQLRDDVLTLREVAT
ncbi:PREDICTED: uncharacterized protein LOC106804772 [Priapulus caudatus]|uniref:Uncharacterized protein LOC106804772 n=1 Tax=Priapulus caudatus TaxID=37621 RepID=A0ABM1DNR2_PRICU|nr:PREDICTED: uncharacterized protein LOC106804772 [Priapulus caudatus]